MNINIVKKKKDIFILTPKGDNVLEVYENDGFLDYYLFNPKDRSLTEIAPEIRKSPLIKVFNCAKDSAKVFFCAIEENRVSVYRDEEGGAVLLCGMDAGGVVDGINLSIKVFILSETKILIQKEILDRNEENNFVGNIRFELTLFDAFSGQSMEITEDTYINNGICLIKGVSKTEILVKTGFNHLEDDRIPEGSEQDALIEGVYYGSREKFIENLFTSSTMHDLDLLYSSYNDKFILMTESSENYIYYTVADADMVHAETYFYNFRTDEKIVFRNDNFNKDDIDTAYVVDDTPFIRITDENSVDFLNLKSADVEISFPGEEFVSLTGKLFIMRKKRLGKYRLRLYNYPKLKMVLEEKADGCNCIKSGDNYYVYV